MYIILILLILIGVITYFLLINDKKKKVVNEQSKKTFAKKKVTFHHTVKEGYASYPINYAMRGTNNMYNINYGYPINRGVELEKIC